MLIFPQDEHEGFLISELSKLGVSVERLIELTGFKDLGGRIEAELKTLSGDEKVQCQYIAGCDGAHSKVREVLKTGFPGETYSRFFYVADVVAKGPAINRELHVTLDDIDFLAIFPLAGEGRARLLGTLAVESENPIHKYEWKDVSSIAMKRAKVEVEKLNWFSTYHVHHRVTMEFKKGRAFLLGDAAHIHSPVGGQGMNTGIGDAINLAWKLADVLKGRASEAILETCEPERIAFAKRLVHTTDQAFTFINHNGKLAKFVRLKIAPKVLQFLFKLEATRKFLFRTVSQTAIEYHDSPLSEGSAKAKAGDRLPWVKVNESEDNFQFLKDFKWQIQIYGEASKALMEFLKASQLPCYIIPWNESMVRAFEKNALYLVRPDGYIAFADPKGQVDGLQKYLGRLGLKI
jgi:2-polyprenyl-6-methoxyphenol hydroxylase-like FAD-dependent oxidoreductase